MRPFTRLEAIAAAVPISNIDTDMLVPARFLKTISRKGLSDALFHNLRVGDATFPLNLAPWTSAGILIGGDNFGCGSSREHAPWALLDFGIRCVIAPSFADIFHQNCFKNGILPITIDSEQLSKLAACAADPGSALMTVDLSEQTIVCCAGTFRFSIDASRRKHLLLGADDVAVALLDEEVIAAHEKVLAAAQPWVVPLPQSVA